VTSSQVPRFLVKVRRVVRFQRQAAQSVHRVQVAYRAVRHYQVVLRVVHLVVHLANQVVSLVAAVRRRYRVCLVVRRRLVRQVVPAVIVAHEVVPVLLVKVLLYRHRVAVHRRLAVNQVAAIPAVRQVA
jgi:hypothetical protein